MNDTKLGERIADLLNASGMTQRDLARKIDISDVTMSRYISGYRTPKGPLIAKIAQVLNTTSDYLLGNELEEEDFVIEYNRLYQLITKLGPEMNKKQRNELIKALLETDSD